MISSKYYSYTQQLSFSSITHFKCVIEPNERLYLHVQLHELKKHPFARMIKRWMFLKQAISFLFLFLFIYIYLLFITFVLFLLLFAPRFSVADFDNPFGETLGQRPRKPQPNAFICVIYL